MKRKIFYWRLNTLFICGDRKEMEYFLELSKTSTGTGMFQLNGTYKTPEILMDDINRYFYVLDSNKIEEEVRTRIQKLGWGISEEGIQKEISSSREAIKENKRRIKETGFTNRYEWRINNWGTGFDVYGKIESNGICFKISFCSAWKSPIKWLKKVAIDFPNIKFQLNHQTEEVGSEKIVFVHGERFENNSSDILSSKFWNDIEESP